MTPYDFTCYDCDTAEANCTCGNPSGIILDWRPLPDEAHYLSPIVEPEEHGRYYQQPGEHAI